MPKKEKENNTIKQILYNNKYDPSIINLFIPTRKEKGLDRKYTSKTKWAKFTYIGRENILINSSRIITLKSHTTRNIIDKLLPERKNSYNKEKFEKCGI